MYGLVWAEFSATVAVSLFILNYFQTILDSFHTIYSAARVEEYKIQNRTQDAVLN